MKLGKRLSVAAVTLSLLGVALAGCSSGKAAAATSDKWSTVVKTAKKEGIVKSVGMPDTWANWIGSWNDIKAKYGLSHKDTDMSSAQELQNFKNVQGKKASDIGDIGINVGPTATKKNLLMPYKSQYWDKIPTWAKDKKGYWAAGYTGTIAFITDTKNVKATDAPKSWADLAKGNYKVSVGDVATEAQAQYAVLAAAHAKGGSETDVKPGINFFADLHKKDRLSTVDTSIDNFKKGEQQVAVVWDFNALNYRKLIGGDKDRFKISIPTDGTVTSGYAEVLNKKAAHPAAAKLARSFILSDQGQINLAKGFARPIRSDVKLPDSVKSQLLPDSDYKNVYHVKNNDKWNTTTVKLAQMWQSDVMGKK